MVQGRSDDLTPFDHFLHLGSEEDDLVDVVESIDTLLLTKSVAGFEYVTTGKGHALMADQVAKLRGVFRELVVVGRESVRGDLLTVVGLVCAVFGRTYPMGVLCAAVGADVAGVLVEAVGCIDAGATGLGVHSFVSFVSKL